MQKSSESFFNPHFWLYEKHIAAQLTTHQMSFGLFTRSLMYHHPGLRSSLRPSYAITVTVLAMERLR